MSTNWNDLVSGDELLQATKERKNAFLEEKVSPDKKDEYINKGWEVFKEYKNGSVRMRKEKPIGTLFENEVWLIFQKMGFKVMNATNKFRLDFGDSSKQIDIVAIDDEICLLIECKATAEEGNTKTWKTDLEAINGNYRGLVSEIKTKYPQVKVKYIFATKNYIIGNADNERMEAFKIANFNYDIVKYYKDLTDHLGSAARYQLLGNLFAKAEIKGINSNVPAIEGKMGNNMTYYTFLIEPERLLKLAYILHRNKANHKLMPTYQRIIKKERLASIRKFVDEGGYFPNSLIVSIDTNGRGVVFEPASKRTDDNQSRMGILKLPKTYQSLYVIDGQHRLYGYSDSKFASRDSIPVVAFVDMKKQEQVKLFMDINENQKPVPKGLRNTLNIDLLWNAELYSQRQEALRLDLGLQLGEDVKSPLYGRVVTGEDSSDIKRCITLDYINDALKQSNFFNIYKKGKNEIQTPGTFDKTDNDATETALFPFLTKCFGIIKDYCSEEWNKGSEGFLAINNTTFALIKVFNDIVNIHLKKDNKVIVDDVDDFYSECEVMLLELADTINSLDADTKTAIKSAKGGGAKKTSWNKLREAFTRKYPDYTYPELEEHMREYCVNNNPYASQYIKEIIDEIRKRLKEKIGNDPKWMHKYLPEKMRNELISKVAIEEANLRNRGNDEKVDAWEYISFNEVKLIANYGSNWSTFCSDVLILQSNKMNKINTLEWLTNLESAKNRISMNQSIVTSEFEIIKKIRDEYITDESCEAV